MLPRYDMKQMSCLGTPDKTIEGRDMAQEKFTYAYMFIHTHTLHFAIFIVLLDT